MKSRPKVVVMGGGTGSFMLLSALKDQPIDITAIVSMADDGGSTGQLRDEYGVLPPGDIRQCLVALSDSRHLRELFNFRFPDGSFGGHSFGNLLLSALEIQHKNFETAVDVAADILQINGRVVPITLEKCKLVYTDPNGQKIFGENQIENTDYAIDMKPKISYDQPVNINRKAKKSIEQADFIIIAPGSLYTSLIPLFVVNGTVEALKHSKAKIIYVANLVNKPLETKNYHVVDYVKELERYAKIKIDVVLYNIGRASHQVTQNYIKDGEEPVNTSKDKFKNATFTAISGNFLSPEISEVNKNDPLSSHRSLIRHDQINVCAALLRLFFDRPEPTQ